MHCTLLRRVTKVGRSSVYMFLFCTFTTQTITNPASLLVYACQTTSDTSRLWMGCLCLYWKLWSVLSRCLLLVCRSAASWTWPQHVSSPQWRIERCYLYWVSRLKAVFTSFSLTYHYQHLTSLNLFMLLSPNSHTCSMGNPLYADDLGEMCFNPASEYMVTLLFCSLTYCISNV